MKQINQKSDLSGLILRFSLDTLITHGAAGFSAPLVAKAAKIRQSHITYYFPTRAELLTATVKFALGKYEKEFEKQLARIDKFTIKKSHEFLRWLFTDSLDPKTVKTFPQLWALAGSDKEIAKTVQELYLEAALAVMKALGLDTRPGKNQKTLNLLLVIGSISEGLTAIHGHRKKTDPIYVATRETAIKVLAPQLFDLYKKAQKAGKRE
jgi:AcrR family transcriptional regulator